MIIEVPLRKILPISMPAKAWGVGGVFGGLSGKPVPFVGPWAAGAELDEPPELATTTAMMTTPPIIHAVDEMPDFFAVLSPVCAEFVAGVFASSANTGSAIKLISKKI